MYYTKNEFSDKVIVNGEIILSSVEEINARYNVDGRGYKPVDGTVVKGCDHLAAFVEAWLSRRYGITSKHLEDGETSIRAQYKGKVIGGIDFGSIYEEFEPNK